MRGLIVFLIVSVSVFVIDQGIKVWAVSSSYEIKQQQYQKRYHKELKKSDISEASLVGTTLKKGKYIDLELHFNKGVAFSMFKSLGPYVKWIQASLVLLILYFIFTEGYLTLYAFPAGLIIGGALGNVYDRFYHIGVVDYVAWHYKFDYAIFNFADIAIDIAFIIIVIMLYRTPKVSEEG